MRIAADMELYRPPPYNPHFSDVDGRTRHGPSPAESVGRRAKPQAPPPPYPPIVASSSHRRSPDVPRTTTLPKTFAGGHRHVRTPLSNVFPQASSSERGDAAAQNGAVGQRAASDVISQSLPRTSRRQLFDRQTTPTDSCGSGDVSCRSGTESLGRVGRHRPRLPFDSVGRSRGRREFADLDRGRDAPAPPPRRLPGEPISSPVKCLQRFSVYSDEEVLNSGAHVVLSVDVSRRGDVVVVDSQLMRVYVFSSCGNRLHHPFRVLGVVSGCFLGDDRLAFATHRGVRICSVDGSDVTDLAVGDVIRVKAYGRGFVAVRSCSVSIYRTTADATPTKTIAKLRRSRFFQHRKVFVRIADVAITARSMLAVLDVGKGVVYVADDTGLMLSKISLSGTAISTSACLAVDRNDSFLLSDPDKKQLLHYGARGDFVACLLDFSIRVGDVEVDGTPSPHGIAFGPQGHLAVAVCGDAVAEIRTYKL